MIEECLMNEYGYAGENLAAQQAKLAKYPDILAEFGYFVKERKFLDQVQSAGYTASQIQELAPFMTAVGVYNFLVDLRDQPEAAKQMIQEGFPRA